ncbi:MAG: Smr/MutS family protein [Robiginitomaculum sp.]|nr:Smr/MutS family protein [Robiginitomaculum sp.]MDQ7078896.1 Smr/MutS family protein [Robiginitomaculum sp.]
MSRRPDDDEDETGQFLWEQVKASVSPLARRKPSGPAHKTAGPVRYQRAAPALRPRDFIDRPVMARPRHTSAIKSPAPPEDRSSHKKVRRGQVQAQARIDLHGKRHDEARAYLLRRLEECAYEHIRCVLVITGRGIRDEGVLRTGLPNWMGEGVFRTLVSGYAPAHTRHGGKGAWYIFLRKTP